MKSTPSIMVKHHGATELIKGYLIAYISHRLKTGYSTYFSVKMPAIADTGFSTLQSRLQSSSKDEGPGILGLPPVDKLRFDVADMQPAAKKFVNILRNSVFCCVVRHSPSKLVRHHVMGEIGFHASDSVVGIHDFVGAAVASDQPTAWVDVESTH